MPFFPAFICDVTQLSSLFRLDAIFVWVKYHQFSDAYFNGVYQINPLVRKVYGAASLVTVWSQEGGLVPSDGLQRSPNA